MAIKIEICLRLAGKKRATEEGGIGLLERDQLLENLIELENESQRFGETLNEAKKQRIKKEKVEPEALEMRKNAMEGFSKQEKEEERGVKLTVMKRGGDDQMHGEMMEWFRERTEVELEDKEMDHTIKREELKVQRFSATL